MDHDEIRITTYTCTTGHEITRADFEALTEVQRLDDAIDVRVCKEHGAVVAANTAPEKSWS